MKNIMLVVHITSKRSNTIFSRQIFVMLFQVGVEASFFNQTAPFW